MARDLDDDTYYTVQSQGGKIPVKWTAPEVAKYIVQSSTVIVTSMMLLVP